MYICEVMRWLMIILKMYIGRWSVAYVNRHNAHQILSGCNIKDPDISLVFFLPFLWQCDHLQKYAASNVNASELWPPFHEKRSHEDRGKDSLCNTILFDKFIIFLYWFYTDCCHCVFYEFCEVELVFCKCLLVSAATIVSLDSWQFAVNAESECGR